MTGRGWTPEELRLFAAATELSVAVRRPDGTARRALPVWVVTAGSGVYVRTWYRRDTGWFGHVLRTGRATVSVPGLTADVIVEDVGATPQDTTAGGGPERLRAEVDAAYRAKYGRYGAAAVGPMVAPAAAATTLRLSPR